MRLFLAITMVGVATLTGHAQSDSTGRKTSLTLASIYSTNASYYGQTAEERLPYVLLNATLRTPYYFYLTAGGYKLLTIDDGASAAQLGAGFEFELGKNVELGLGYIRSFYAKNSPLLQAANTDNVSASLAVEHAFKTELTGDYMFGKEADYFVTLGNSKKVKIGQFNPEDMIVIEPGIDVVAGTQRYYQYYVSERQRLGRLVDLLPVSPPGLGRSGAETDTVAVQSTDFKMISYTFTLPVYYFRASYAVAVTYQLSVLDPNVEAISRKPRSFLSIGFYYQF
ncbi:hypothetical protein ACFQRK_03995 [Parapedobacter sp. GCM10030251]|uniref:hypothetical protein n=1 Tax=Parapedobacter sp. GCM10030251 TaxID=3273419 RepID=UPI00361DEA77